MPTSVCFFNNKGGVGKTTLACNIGSFLALEKNKKVLIIDADPQCNATQLILTEETTKRLYDTNETTGATSLHDILEPIRAGDASLRPPFKPIGPESNRFGVSIIPGHPAIALLEDKLSQNWTNFLGGDLGGARVSNWNTQLLKHISNDFDIVIYDVGPSLGALNRSVLIGVDFFISPMGCDIFSLIGIDNIAQWLKQWKEQYNRNMELTIKQNTPTATTTYEIQPNSEQISQFIGYTVQQYITKTIRSERRPTAAFESIMKSIPARINEALSSAIAPSLSETELRLGDVPHMYSLVPLAQTANAPVHGLNNKDGLSGGQYTQLNEYKSFIGGLSSSIIGNLSKTTKDRK